MKQQYDKEKLWGLYNELPEELKSAIFSEKTATDIWDICVKNEVKKSNVSDIAQLVGQVFLGLIPPKDLDKEIKKTLGLNQEKSKKISQEIERFILFSVKNSLAELYGIEYSPGEPKKKEIHRVDEYREDIK